MKTNPTLSLSVQRVNIHCICFVRFDFVGIQIAIGIEIDLLNSDFDSEPDSDLDYPGIRTVCYFPGFALI